MCEWEINVISVLFFVMLCLFIILMIVGVLRLIYEVITDCFKL